MDHQLLRIRHVISMTGLSRTGIYERIKNGTFPRSVKIGARSVAWQAVEVRNWIENRVSESKTTSEVRA